MIRGLKFTTKGGPGSGNIGHAGRPGSVGGSAPSSQASLEQRVGAYMEEIGIPFEHSDGLNISGEPSSTHIEENGKWYSVFDPTKQSLALYDPRTQTIHLSPGACMSKQFENIIVHELGHHVHASINRKLMGSLSQAVGNQLIPALRNQGTEGLKKTGLRSYSLTKPRELIADAYSVWALGPTSQRTQLNEMFKEYTNYDLSEVFGEKM